MTSLMLCACLGLFHSVADGDVVWVVVHMLEEERDGSCCLAFLCGGVNSPLLSPPPPAGRQVSLRLAEEAKKKERFEELKHHLEQEQEVVTVWKQFLKRVWKKIEVYINWVLMFARGLLERKYDACQNEE